MSAPPTWQWRMVEQGEPLKVGDQCYNPFQTCEEDRYLTLTAEDVPMFQNTKLPVRRRVSSGPVVERILAAREKVAILMGLLVRRSYGPEINTACIELVQEMQKMDELLGIPP